MASRIAAQANGRRPVKNGDWLTRQHVLALILLGATATALVLCYLMVSPFLPAVAWALALAVVARPLHAWIASRIANVDAAAGVTVLLVALGIIGPACWVGFQLMQEAAAAFGRVQDEAATEQWRDGLEQVPALASFVAWTEANLDIDGETRRLIGVVTEYGRSALSASVGIGLQLLITLLTLYYFFRDHRAVLKAIRSLVPLSNPETDEVFARVADTVHATVYGTLAMALLQGAMGGLMFWLLGLPAPLLWGTIMALLAVVPYLGAFVVWAPAALLLGLEGSWGRALILTAWGGIAIAFIDNLLYPVLVGNRLRMHPLPIFFALFGGLAVFGASGVILGPVVFALAMALVDIWRRRTAGGNTAEAGVEEGARPVAAG